MKIKGKKIEGANIEIIPILRSEGDIFLKAQAILDMNEFDKMCPAPKPPKRKIGTEDVPNLKDVNYLKALDLHAENRLNWMIITSLKATEDLEWETIDLGDSSTWRNVRKELKDSGFTEFEINRIIAGVMTANSLNEAKLEEARERFLL